MYTTCVSCGATINGDLDLCPYCGKPVPRTQESKANWDFCGILAVRTMKKRLLSGKVEWECYFQARGMGKNGPYILAETDRFSLIAKWSLDAPDPMSGNEADRRIATEKLNGLIQILKNGGWEAMPQTGTQAWDLKFKRKMSVSQDT